MIYLNPQWCCTQSTVLLEGCWTWSTVFLSGASHRAQYTHGVLHMEPGTPTGVLDVEYSVFTGCCTQSTVPLQSAAHRTQYSHRGAAMEHSTPTGVLPWSTVLPHSAACRAWSSCSASTERHTPGVSGKGSSCFTVAHSVGSGSNPSHLVSSYLSCDFPLL